MNQFCVISWDRIVLHTGHHTECCHFMQQLVKQGQKPEINFDLYIWEISGGMGAIGRLASYSLSSDFLTKILSNPKID